MSIEQDFFDGQSTQVVTLAVRMGAEVSKGQENEVVYCAYCTPHTFKEMFEPNEGDNPVQRLAKWWLKPRGNPETTIKLLKALQVHQFQKLVKMLVGYSPNGYRYQSTYTVKDSRLSSLIDYAANQSAFNEAWHIAQIVGFNVPFGAMAVVIGSEVGMAAHGVAAFLNAYLVLAQYYSRARCERLIDRSLARGKTVDFYEYSNRLNLRLPPSISR